MGVMSEEMAACYNPIFLIGCKYRKMVLLGE
jgi:hypothetical protein